MIGDGQQYVITGGMDNMIKVWSSSGSGVYENNMHAVVTCLKTGVDHEGTDKSILFACIVNIFVDLLLS